MTMESRICYQVKRWLSNTNIVPSPIKKNVPCEQLGPVCSRRTNIHLSRVIDFVEKRFDKSKESTKFEHLERTFGIRKARAQRILKTAVLSRVLFSPCRTNPQNYYPESRHFQVIEYLNNKESVLKDTTGTSHSQQPLSNCLEQLKAKNFLDAIVLLTLSSRPLKVHKLLLETYVDKECYNLISGVEWKGNRGKPQLELVENTHVTCIYYKNGKVSIDAACARWPFRIETEADLALLYSFLGQIRDRIERHIHDPRGRLTPNITGWILKQCDFNKDIPITDRAQITLPDIQLSTAFETFRLYVKNLQGQAYFRCEDSMQINQPVTYLESIINPNGRILSKLEQLTKEFKEMKEHHFSRGEIR